MITTMTIPSISILICLISITADPVIAIKVLTEGSLARERVDAIFLRCDVINLGPEEEIFTVTWRHNDTTRGVWQDVFTIDLTNDVPAYFFFSLWTGRGQYNPISLATIMLAPSYVTRYSSGTYRCQVETSNTRGYADTYVDIYYGPGTSIAITPDGRVQKTEGEELLLSCHAQCNPTCTYRWYKSGRRLSSLSSLRMTSISRHDAGLYACQARNEAGRSIKPVEIRVLFQPAILELISVSRLLNASSGSGSNGPDVVLQCRIQAWPEPEVRWLKGTHSLRNSTHTGGIEISTMQIGLEHTTSRLKIWNATSCLHNGVYTCKAHNSIGDAITQNINITHDCPPYQVLNPDFCPFVSGTPQHGDKATMEMEKKIGDEVLIQLCFTGYPLPTVKIRRKTEKSNKFMNLQIPNPVCNKDTGVCMLEFSFIVTSPLQYGTYDAKITNRLQSFTKTYRIVSRQAPLPPTDVAVTSVTSTSVCISWQAGYDGGSDQTFNITYSKLYSYSDDGNVKMNHIIFRTNQNSGKTTRTRGDIFFNERDPPFQISTREYRHNPRRQNGDIMGNEATNSHTSSLDVTELPMNISSCIKNLIPSTTYSLQIEASNVYGNSKESKTINFKTLLDPLTTKTTTTTIEKVQSPPRRTRPTTTMKRNHAQFWTTLKVAIESISSSETIDTEQPTHVSTQTPNHKLHNIFDNKKFHHRAGDFDHSPIHDEGAGTEDAIHGKSRVSNRPSPNPNRNPPTVMISSSDDDYFWNSEEEHYPNHNNKHHNHNNDNNNNFLTLEDGDPKPHNNNYDVNSPNLMRDDDDSNDYAYDESDDMYDDQSESEGRRLFQALFPYFQSVLFHQDSNTPSPPTSQNGNNNNDTQSPLRGPFEVERYYKKYNHVEKLKHIPISSDNLFPIHNLHVSTTYFPNRQNIDTDASNVSTNTRPTPRSDSNSDHSIVTSSLSIGSLAILFLVISIILLKVITKRCRKRSQNSTAKLTPRPEYQHGQISTTSKRFTRQTMSAPSSGVKMISHFRTHGQNSNQNINNSASTHRPLPHTTNNQNGQNSVSSHSDTDYHHPPQKSSSIISRPRLSTPKVHRRDRIEYTYTNPKASSKDSTSSLAKTKTIKATQNISSHQILTIPGISVNDKRISSPSYLEICMGSNSSCESGGHHSQLHTKNFKLQENTDTQSIRSGKTDALATRRSSYSSVILPSDVLGNSDKLDDMTGSKWNSYLDLCEALSVKSGSRSPSNIYDPLDISDKISIRSVGSYMSAHTPETARKALEGHNTNNNPCVGEGLYQQYSPLNFRKHVLSNKRKLCSQPSESDTSCHYEKCVSLTYDKDEIERIKSKNKKSGKEINVPKPEKTNSVPETKLKPDLLPKTVEYMNDRNGKKLTGLQRTSYLNNYNNKPRDNTQQKTHDQDIENNNSIYNEIIDVHTRDNDINELNDKNSEQGDLLKANTNLNIFRRNNKGTSPATTNKSLRQGGQSPWSNVDLNGNMEDDEMAPNRRVTITDNSRISTESKVRKECQYATPKASVGKKNPKSNDKKRTSSSSRQFQEISRKDSGSHYYSDIDTKD